MGIPVEWFASRQCPKLGLARVDFGSEPEPPEQRGRKETTRWKRRGNNGRGVFKQSKSQEEPEVMV
jgi:hypothetical protein